ncbi:lysophospholipid acyltransferase family protein [Alkalimarinus alittae]|uniref:Lysophospholipid acyltransferase family protein n=1 Tax=Alkalimarinus alittae TaxID=2961619 RepID=A0ABY6N217_9ALTE|nr:lysophospholipid acyltransferase family protein [Alkalimarinus alittae]UZE96134.1 lysophospholipid acyltransferase family protein [Alkalimarinus alittae]
MNKARWVIFAIKLMARMRLRTVQRLGILLGRLLWVFKTDQVRVSDINLKLCYPELSEQEREALVRKSLEETCKTALEVGMAWEWPIEKCFEMIRVVEGQHLIDEAIAREEGILLLAPHLGNWELTGLYFSSMFNMAALYRPPKVKELETYMSTVRGRVGSELVPTDKRGVLRLFKILRSGGVVGILPDQEPPFSGGEFAPFFGVEANTMKLVSKLVGKTGATVLCTYAERLPNGDGFKIVIKEADRDIASDDLITSITALNRSVESCVRDIPEQYQWEYKRFKRRRKGEKHYYDKGRVW